MPVDTRIWAGLATVAISGALTLAVVSLFYGWKFYRIFTSILTTCAAGMSGWFFVSPHIPGKASLLAPLILSAVGAAVSLLLVRIVTFTAIGLLGAGIASAIGVSYYEVPLDIRSAQLIAVASAGFIVAGIPAAIFHRFLAILATSAYGAVIAVASIMWLVVVCATGGDFQNAEKLEQLRESMPATQEVLTAVLAAWVSITVLGIVFQYRTARREAGELE